MRQAGLAANVVGGSVPYQLYIGRITGMLQASGMGAAQASQVAMGRAYQDMLRQASMLSYQGAFRVLALVLVWPDSAAVPYAAAAEAVRRSTRRRWEGN